MPIPAKTTEPAPDAHARLAQDGWAIFPALDAVTLARVTLLAERFAAVAADPFEGGSALGDAERGLRTIWRVPDPSTRRRFVTELTDALRAWCDANFPDHRLISSTLTIKRAGIDHEPLPFHRDHAFLDERAGIAALHLWIPLVDVSPANGGLVLVNGTHLTAPAIRPLGAVYADPLVSQPLEQLSADAVQPTLSAGAVIAFDNRTTHASPPNRSDRDRPVAMALLLPRGAQMIEWVPRNGQVELWAMREEDTAFVTREHSRERLLEIVPWDPVTLGPPREAEQVVNAAPVEDLGRDVGALIAPLLGSSSELAGHRLAGARALGGQLLLDFAAATSALTLVVETIEPGMRCYKRLRGDLGLSYKPTPGASASPAEIALLEAFARVADRAAEPLRALLGPQATGGAAQRGAGLRG